MHKYLKNPIFEILAFVLFLLACWMIFYTVGSVVQHFFGNVVMVITMPIWWYYIVSPILDEVEEYFTKNYWN